jgi:hypothetical protein
VATGLLLVADSFVPWFRYCVGIPGYRRCASHAAWANEWSTLALVVTIALGIDVVLARRRAVARGETGTRRLRRGVRIVVSLVVVGLVGLQLAAGDEPMGPVAGAIAALVLACVLIVAALLAAADRDDVSGVSAADAEGPLG